MTAPDSLVARLRRPFQDPLLHEVANAAADRIEQLEYMLKVAVEENTELLGMCAARDS